MRFVRRAGLIPEHEFVAYRLPVATRPRPCQPAPDLVLVPRVRRLRHQYQVGLLGVIHNRALEMHLRFLSHTLDRLQQLCGEQETWQLTQGLLEALLTGGLTLDISIKHMLGRVDRQIREYAAPGASSNRAMDEELHGHLLYYLAKAEPAGERIRTLQTRYQLAGCVPDERHLEQERHWLQTPDRAATGAVAKALLEDLAEVKSGLLTLQRPDGTSSSLLRTQIRRLDQIALTLEVLGLDSAMRQCRGLARQLPGLTTDGAGVLANQLIGIETTLQAYAQGVPVEVLNRNHCDHLRLAEDNTLREAHQAIAGICEVLEEYFDPYAPQHGQRSHIRDVAPLLHQVEGALQMLELHELAESLRPLAVRLDDQERPLPPPGSAELESMADAIASVEWFLEDYGKERRHRPQVAAPG
jgi:chemosensory pili system protein ChpA (sensor histidine kinase/response regulator)